MYKLYGSAGTGSTGPQAILAQIGATHEMIMLDLTNEERRSPENLAMNPRGQVPWLVTSDGVLTESAAIMLHLGDCHPDSGLLGPIGSIERANTYKWMSFLSTNIYECVLRSEYTERYTTDTHTSGVKAAAHRDIDAWWEIVEEALTPGPLLLGDGLTVADIYLAMLTGWHHDVAALQSTCPNVKRATDTVLSQPKIRQVFSENDLV